MGQTILQSGNPPPELETAPKPAVGWHVWCSAATAPGYSARGGSVTLAYINMQRRAPHARARGMGHGQTAERAKGRRERRDEVRWDCYGLLTATVSFSHHTRFSHRSTPVTFGFSFGSIPSKVLQTTPRVEYILTAPEGNVTSRLALLNGGPLLLGADGSLPIGLYNGSWVTASTPAAAAAAAAAPAKAKKRAAGAAAAVSAAAAELSAVAAAAGGAALTVPPLSFGFVVFPTARVAACMSSAAAGPMAPKAVRHRQ